MRFILFSLFILSVQAKEYTANDTSQIRIIANKLKAGDTVKLTAQVYKAGLTLSNLQGTSSKPIIIDGQNKAVFQKGKSGIHLVDCHHVILKNLTVKDISINGINIDDGGTQETPPEGIILDNVTVLNVGPKGNFDCVKLSGLNKFIIKNCTISGWGGSAIDMVGCHNGLIENNRLIGKSGFSQSSGIQIKGGSFGTKVFNNFFDNAGSRAINLGGSTGLEWFRPKGANFEAKDIEVAGNIFKGSESFIAFVTCTNGYVHHNIETQDGSDNINDNFHDNDGDDYDHVQDCIRGQDGNDNNNDYI